MTRVFLVLLEIVGLALANGKCKDSTECDCGSACNKGTCEPGCQVYDKFMAAGSETDIYGRMCQCGTTPDADGLPIMCPSGGTFKGAPKGMPMYTRSAKC